MSLRIAVVTDEGTDGGASIAATRLCRVLRQRGHHVARLHHARFELAPDSCDDQIPLALRDFTSRALAGMPLCETTRRMLQRRWVQQIGQALDRFQPDIIHLHNLHNAGWDIEVVTACAKRAPIVWTMHDMWPFTGSCVHSMECTRFAERCTRACPQTGRYPTLPAALVPSAHRRRKAFFARRPPVALVAPSKWLARRARASLPTARLERIRTGVDLECFQPIPHADARRALGLPPEDGVPTFLASAASLDDQRKGIDDLLRAMGRMDRRIRLLLLGAMRRPVIPDNVEAFHLGRVAGDRFLMLAHNAADVFIMPSHAENFPLVVIEAMACGRPVAATPVGGVTEQIRLATGWLASSPGVHQMEELVHRVCEDRRRWVTMGRAARERAMKRFAIERQTDRYEALHDQLLGNGATRGTRETK